MRRIVPLLLLVVVAAVVIFGIIGRGDRTDLFSGPDVEAIEELVGRGDRAGAVQRLDSARSSLETPTVAYLDALISLADNDPEKAETQLAVAMEAAPDAWRPLSMMYVVLDGLSRRAEAATLVADALEAAPEDERVLALAAQHFVNEAAGDDPVLSLELLDRIDALPARMVPASDRTAVRDDQLLRTRVVALSRTDQHLAAYDVAQRLVSAAPGEPLHQAMLGEAARRAEKPAEAIEAFEMAVRAVPTMVEWREHLVQLLLDRPGRTGDVLTHTETLLQQTPRSRSARVLRARALVRSQDEIPNAPDEAVAIYQSLLMEDPTDLTVLRNYAVLLYDWKQGGQQGAYLERAHSLLSMYVRLGGVIDDKLKVTWRKLQDRAAARLDEGELGIRRAQWKDDKGDPELLEAYCAELVRAGLTVEIGRAVREGVASAAPPSKKRPRVLILAAEHFLVPGADFDPTTALTYIDEASEKLRDAEGELPESILWMRCRARLGARRFVEAAEDAGALCTLRADYGPYVVAWAEANEGLGEHFIAARLFWEALPANPQDRELHDGLIRNLLEVPDQSEAALKLADDVLQQLPGDPRFRLLRARALLGVAGRLDEGVRELDALYAATPKDRDVLLWYAIGLHAAERFDDARRVVRRFEAAGGDLEGRIAPVVEAVRPSDGQ